MTHDGLITVDRARVWSLPDVPPPLLGAAVTPATAAWVGGWADGLITVNQPLDDLRQVLDAFRSEAGDDKPAVLQVHVSWAATDEEALRIAHEQWAPAIFGSPVGWALDLPQEFEEIASYVSPEDMHPSVLASSAAQQHVDWLAELAELGFDEVYVHHVGKQQAPFLDVYGSTVLPALRAA
nr:LLM class flavin-dependent oxidoreductase [Isoptericola croceus]